MRLIPFCILFLLFACKPANKDADGTAANKPVETAIEETSAEPAHEIEAPSAPDIETADDFIDDILDGWLEIGLGQNEVIAQLGHPESLGELVYWGATGSFVQEWHYPGQGIQLKMEASEQDGPKQVMVIDLSAPFAGRNSHGFSIGSPKEAVLKAHEGAIDPDFSTEDQIVVGSIYGGIIYSFKNGQVSHIFIGAAAE